MPGAVPTSDLPGNLVPADDLPAPQSNAVPESDLPGAPAPVSHVPPPGTPPPPTQFHPNSAIRMTPNPHAQQATQQAARQAQNPLAKSVEQGLGGIWGAVTGAVKSVEDSGMHMLNDTLGAADAVLGAPGRAVQGAIAANGNVIDKVRGAIDNVTHPYDRVKVGHNLEVTMDRLGVTGLDKAVERSIPENLPFGMTKKARDAVHFMSVIGAQTITDPTMMIPVADAIGLTAHVAQTARDVQRGIEAVGASSHPLAPVVRAAQTTGQGVMKAGAHLFGRRPELDEHLTPDAKAARLSIENKIHTNISAPSQINDEKLLESIKDELRQKDAAGNYIRPVPEALRQRLLQEGYVYGTPAMRAEGLAQGYDQLTIKLKGQKYFDDQQTHNNSAPYGALNYNVAKDYNTMIRAKNIKDSDMFDQFGANGGNSYTRAKAKDKAAFEQKATGNQNLGDQDPMDVWRARLASGRIWTTRRLVDNETESFLKNHGGVKEYDGKPFDWENASQVDRAAAAAQAVDKLSYDPVRYELGGVLGKIAGSMRNASRWSIMLNPLPHGLRNIGALTYLSGGPRAFGEGLAHAAMGISATDAARLENLGLHADYIRDMQGPLGQGVVGAAFRADSSLMNRLEGGFRNALLHHYDRVLGPSKSIADEYRKADLVRRDLGDYRNASRFVAALEAVGGPFVVFRIGTVPSAVGRAVRARPYLPESIARAENDQTLPDPRLSDTNSRLRLGGPVTDAAEVTFDPVGYMSKPATSGLVGQAMQERDRLKEGFGQAPKDIAEQMATNYIPGASLLGGAVNVGADALHKQLPWQPYGDTGLPQGSALRLLLENLIGFYNTKKPSAKSELHREKMLDKTVGP